MPLVALKKTPCLIVNKNSVRDWWDTLMNPTKPLFMESRLLKEFANKSPLNSIIGLFHIQLDGNISFLTFHILKLIYDFVCTKTLLSIVWLRMNALCHGWILFSRIGFIWFTIIIAIVLYNVLHKLICLNWLVLSGLPTFGIRVINVWLSSLRSFLKLKKSCTVTIT